MKPLSAPSPRAAVPWVTLAVAWLALAVFASRGLEGRLVFERAAIRQGEWWRLWTGNWVHFSSSHLLWNLVVLVPAGIWVERLAPARARFLLLLAPAVIGGAILVIEPALQRYGGLSGVAAGVLALLAIEQLARGAADRWFWWAVLVLLAAKIVGEMVAGHALFAQFNDLVLRTVPLAHVAGVVSALAVHFGVRRI